MGFGYDKDRRFVKNAQFNRPPRDQKIGARHDPPGRDMDCPTCGQRFTIPTPRPIRGAMILVALALLIGGASIAVVLDNRARPESEYGRVSRFRAEARADLFKECTNQIVGLSRIIDARIDDVSGSDDPRSWSASVTAEFVNKFGGIERTNLPFEFYTEKLGGNSRVLCVPDFKKLLLEKSAQLQASEGRFKPQ